MEILQEKKMDMTTEEKIETVLVHISNVQRNANKLGLKLIRSGQVRLGQNLIANGQIHDNSKLRGIEFEHLFWGSALLSDAVKHHQQTNPHHPEYWDGIHNMPDIYLAEMACDVLARAQEFGQDVNVWLQNEATKNIISRWMTSAGKSCANLSACSWTRASHH